MASEQLSHSMGLMGVGRKETITSDELEGNTVAGGQEVTVFSQQVQDDQRLYHGYGPQVRNRANGFVDLNVQSDAGNPIQGDVILAITDSEGRRVLASTTFDTLQELRDSEAESRSDKRIEPALAPFATSGRNLEVRIEADASSDGDVVDPAASSGKLVFGLIQG